MTHNHVHAPQNYGRLFAIGIALNIAYVVIELFYGWQSSSMALLADAGHNLSDVAGLVLAWVAVSLGKIKPNAKHTFGWKKASILASFLNAVLLLTAMGLLAMESISRLTQESETHAQTVILVASIGVVINAITALLFMRGSKQDLNIRGAFLHMAADALVSLGVVISGLLYLQWGWLWLDPVVSLVIAIIVVVTTLSLFFKSLHLLFDGVPTGVDIVSIHHFLGNHENIASYHDLHVWALSTTEISLSVHVVLKPDCPNSEALMRLSEQLHDKYNISHSTIQIETQQYSEQCHSLNCSINL